MKKIRLFILTSLLIGTLAAGIGCAKGDALAAPEGLEYNIENVLSWSPVEGAKSYVVEVVNVATGEAQTISVKKAAMKTDLSVLAQGDYEIRVRAVAREDDVDGKWSETLHFARGYETGCVYSLINNGTEYQISKYGVAAGTIYIEDEYRGKPVTAIAPRAFKGYPDIEHVYFGKNVKSIGDNAFYNCKNLKSVTFTDTLTTIGAGAFQSCGLLESVSIPDTVTVIEDSTFAYCRSLKELALPQNLTSIGEYAFSDCSSLTEVAIPDTVTRVGRSAFTGNTAVEKVTVGSGLEKIEDSTFYKCSALASVTFSEESSLTEIGSNAFRDCYALTTVVIPEGVESIGAYAFSMQVGATDNGEGGATINVLSLMESVDIPQSVSLIDTGAFFGTKFYMEDYLAGEDYICADDWIVETSTALKAQAVELHEDDFIENVFGIAKGAFAGCAALQEVYLPATLRYISDSAFRSCKKLTTVKTHENSVVSIGKYAFAECDILEYVIFGEGLKKIGEGAFMNCARLDNLEDNVLCPVSLESIAKWAFLGTKLWSKPDKFGVIYAGNWVVGCSGDITAVDISKDAVGIAEYAFANCHSLRSVIVPNDNELKYISRGAFFRCERLDMLTLGHTNVREIGDYAFYGCEGLSSIELPMRLTAIGNSAFSGCEQLSSIDLSGRRVATIGKNAFFGCINLKEVDFGETLTSIGKGAFYQCRALTEVELPSTVTAISDYAFFRCDSIEKLTLGGNEESIGYAAFAYCEGLKRVSLGKKVTSIEDYAFYGCKGLLLVNFNEGLTNIGNYAFFGVEKIAELSLPNSLKSIGRYAFKGCVGVKTVMLHDGIEKVGEHAFYGCAKATFYTEAAALPPLWAEKWNSSYRPVVWGCTFSEDNKYVVSLLISEGSLQNGWVEGGFASPEKIGYEFGGWATTIDGEKAYEGNEIVNAPVGTTLYALWIED